MLNRSLARSSASVCTNICMDSVAIWFRNVMDRSTPGGTPSVHGVGRERGVLGDFRCSRSASSGLGAEVVTNMGSMPAWRLTDVLLVDMLKFNLHLPPENLVYKNCESKQFVNIGKLAQNVICV